MNPTRNKIIETLNGIDDATLNLELAAAAEGFGNDVYFKTNFKFS